MPDALLGAEKKRIRELMLAKRRLLSAAWVEQMSRQICEHVLSWPLYQKAETIMCYLALPDEPQTDALVRAALAGGKQVCVPCLRKQEFGVMDAAAINDLDDLEVGRLGLKEPRKKNRRLVDPQAIDLILVPGVAFDNAGNRLGRGAGYYDRFLARATSATLAGMLWQFQIVDAIPATGHDIPMEYLITEDGIRRCRPGDSDR